MERVIREPLIPIEAHMCISYHSYITRGIIFSVYCIVNAEMDERQWWFASKLQDTFRFSGYDNPSLLEDFLSDDEVSESITRFLGSGGPRKLFFYCEAQEGGYNRTPSLNNRQLQVTDHPGRHMLNKTKDNVCLYVLRRGIFGEVDTSQIDREVYCGEIRHSVIVNLALLLSEAFMPLLHAQENWRMCSFDNQITFLQTFDRLTNNIQESATLSLSHEQHLQQPSQTLRESLTAFQSQNPGRIAIDNEVLLECEALVGEWIGCIEGILIEATDERLIISQHTDHAELCRMMYFSIKFL